MSRNSQTIAAGVKLAVFTVVSLVLTGILAAIMGNFGFGESRTYHAIFTSASMLEKGDDVHVAGVSVGEVTEVEHYQRTMALVTFRVDAAVPMTTESRAEIRFLNLVGDRYLALTEGTLTPGEPATPLADGATIGPEHTAPSLDLTQLFNGFQPLFTALNPQQVNELSLNLVQVLQGEGGTVASLLSRTASLTSTLADRDQLIGEVITNLNTTLTTVNQHHAQLSRLILGLKGWLGKLSRDRTAIGDSLDSISDLSEVTAALLTQSRPLVKADLAELRRLATTLNEPGNTQLLVAMLDRLPEMMTDQVRTGTYGAWYNYYICAIGAKIILPDELRAIPGVPALEQTLNAGLRMHSTAERCQ